MSTKLFSLNLQHDFYKDLELPNVELVPDQNSNRLISRYGLLAIQNNRVYQLNHPGQTNRMEFLHYLIQVGQKVIRFNLISNNSELFQITDLPANFLGQLRFCSSDTQLISEQGHEKTRLVVNYSSEPSTIPGCIGMLEILVADLLSIPVENEGVDYLIRLQARTTEWHYCLFNRSQRQLTNPAIVDAEGWKFEGPETIHIDDEEALLFTSGADRFPLQQVAKRTFALKNLKIPESGTLSSDKAKTLIKELPIPAPSETCFRFNQGEEVGYSQMYVYL